MYVVDADLRIVEASAGARRAFAGVSPLIGCDIAEALRRMWTEPFASEAAGRFRDTLLTGEPCHQPGTVQRRGDIAGIETCDWHLARITLPDGRLGVVCHYYDLSDRQRYETALHESERRLLALVSASSDVVFRMSPDWRELRALVGRGFVSDTIEPHGDWLRRYIHPDAHAQVMAAVGEALRTRGALELEHPVVRADDTVGWTHTRAVPVIDDDGEILEWVGTATDITERKRAESLLLEQQRTLQSFYDSSPLMMGIIELDGDRTIAVSGNRAVAEFMGVVPAMLPGRTGAALGAPGAFERMWVEVYRQCQRDRAPVHFEYRHTHGALLRWLSCTAAFIGIAGTGRPRFSFVVEDVTERKEAERRVFEAHDQLQSVINNTPAIVYAFDLDARFVMANAAMAELWLATPAEMIGRKRADFMPLHDAERQEANDREVIAAGTALEFEETSRLEKRAIDWLTTKFPLRDATGRIHAVAGISTDITERKAAEARQRLLSEAAEVLLTTDDPDAMMLALFGRIAPPLGLDVYLNFVLDENAGALRLASSAGLDDVESALLARMEVGAGLCGQVAHSGQPVVVFHLQESTDPRAALKRSIGLRAYVCHPLPTADGLFGTLAFGSRTRDELTDEELVFLRTTCTYVAASCERLRLVEKLRDADRRKDEFLATLAHELRNPLAPISHSLQIMKLAGSHGLAIDQWRDIIERHVQQMTHLVDDLMDVSRISHGKIALRKTRLSLREAIDNAVEASRPLIDAQGHTLTVRVPPEAVYVEGDLARLSQVFANLLNNAAKYTGRGTGRIVLSVERQGGEVVVGVTDNGLGIPGNMLARVFDMFTQAERDLAQARGGLGIGLNLVQRLVALHGGSVVATSAGPGRGSTFTVRLPVLPDTLPDEAPRAAIASPPASARRILIADDSRDSAEALATLLRLAGNEVHVAYDGRAAVEAAARLAPDVVVLDIAMPELDGYDACRLIREHAGGNAPILIALTGWGQEEVKRRVQDAGFAAHLVKPVEHGRLLAMLANLER
ncbi:MAG: PAS domain-containing protein [Gammaproteobacteria bacterium]|nr:PAS domain-containing protein [Gammaproteobacteria bacterium]